MVDTNLAEKYRKALKRAENRIKNQVSRRVLEIAKSQLPKLLNSVKENPNLSLAQIALLIENQEALGSDLRKARSELEKLIRASHLAGNSLGRKYVSTDLKSRKVAAPSVRSTATSAYLESVIADLHQNIDLALSDFSLKVQEPTETNSYKDKRDRVKQSLTWSLNRLNQRAKAGATVAANRAYSDAQLAYYDAISRKNDASIQKQWVANWTANKPCTFCEALDGQIVDINSEYSSSGGVYRDLQGPPRHPNCSCRLRLVSNS